MLPPCSGLSRRGLETPEIAFTGGVPADLDSPCARRRAKYTVGADSPRFCKCFFALPSRFFSEVGRPDRSSMLAQPTARPSAGSRPPVSAWPHLRRWNPRGRPVGQQGTSRAHRGVSYRSTPRCARVPPVDYEDGPSIAGMRSQLSRAAVTLVNHAAAFFFSMTEESNRVLFSSIAQAT